MSDSPTLEKFDIIVEKDHEPEEIIAYALDSDGIVVEAPGNTKFNQEMANKLITLAAEGETYPAMCGAVDIAPYTLQRWLNPASSYFKKGFYDLFISAYKFGADVLEGKGHAESLDSSDDLYADVDKAGNTIMRPNMASVQRSKLKADSYLRLAGHRNSLKYGRVERALQAGMGDINIQIIQYGGDKKVLQESAVDNHLHGREHHAESLENLHALPGGPVSTNE